MQEVLDSFFAQAQNKPVVLWPSVNQFTKCEANATDPSGYTPSTSLLSPIPLNATTKFKYWAELTTVVWAESALAEKSSILCCTANQLTLEATTAQLSLIRCLSSYTSKGSFLFHVMW